jgi:hypothetical protein
VRERVKEVNETFPEEIQFRRHSYTTPRDCLNNLTISIGEGFLDTEMTTDRRLAHKIPPCRLHHWTGEIASQP